MALQVIKLNQIFHNLTTQTDLKKDANLIEIKAVIPTRLGMVFPYDFCLVCLLATK